MGLGQSNARKAGNTTLSPQQSVETAATVSTTTPSPGAAKSPKIERHPSVLPPQFQHYATCVEVCSEFWQV